MVIACRVHICDNGGRNRKERDSDHEKISHRQTGGSCGLRCGEPCCKICQPDIHRHLHGRPRADSRRRHVLRHHDAGRERRHARPVAHHEQLARVLLEGHEELDVSRQDNGLEDLFLGRKRQLGKPGREGAGRKVLPLHDACRKVRHGLRMPLHGRCGFRYADRSVEGCNRQAARQGLRHAEPLWLGRHRSDDPHRRRRNGVDGVGQSSLLSR